MLAFQKQVKTTGRIYSSFGVKQMATPFSWRKEFREILSFKFLGIFWWPFFKYRQRYFVKSQLFKFCNALPGFKGLWSTIQKGSFAYNHLFLGIKPYQKCSFDTHLADITTLALFFGDEFIDGVCKAAGKDHIREILSEDPQKFCLKKIWVNSRLELSYGFDPNELLPGWVMNDINSRYGISYRKFYEILEQYLGLMNHHLARFSENKAELIADKIMDVCNNCLESYLNDVYNDAADDTIKDVNTVLYFHETKTSSMQKKLLELRCLLADKMDVMQSDQTEGWLNIMRVVQICDDLQDVLEDDGYQDNLVISAAYHKFYEEWKWLKANNQSMYASNETELMLSVKMPQTIHYCLKLASTMIKQMNWEQQKIMHYILFRNWFVEREEDTLNRESLEQVYKKMQQSMPGISEQAIKEYFVETCFHIPFARRMMRKKLAGSTYYQLRYNLLSISTAEKLKVFDKLIKVLQ